MKKLVLFSLISLAAAMACKKDRPADPAETATTAMLAEVGGDTFQLESSSLSAIYFSDEGESTGAFEIQANLDGQGKRLVLFIDAVKTGTFQLSQTFPAIMAQANDKPVPKTMTADSPGRNRLSAAAGANGSTSYVKYVQANTTYFAVSGSIILTIDGGNLQLEWDIAFEDVDGNVFTSKGETTVVDYQRTTKPRSQINNPASALAITSISPDYGEAGTEVTIKGAGFSAVPSENTIMLAGTTITPTAASSTELTFTVPAGTTGPVELKVLENIVSGPEFVYAPSIISFSPARGAIGQTVDIFGKNFTAEAADFEVRFGDIVAQIEEINTAYVKVTIPEGAESGKIRVAIKGRPAVSSTEDFEVINIIEHDIMVPIGKAFTQAEAAIDYTKPSSIIDFYAGRHRVAVYDVPEGEEEHIGVGELEISRDGNQLKMALKSTSAGVLKAVELNVTSAGDYDYESLNRIYAASQQTIGASVYQEGVRTAITAHLNDNGFISGDIYIDGILAYKFRNHVEYFGLTPPPAIRALQGTWAGKHLQPLCGQKDVTLGIQADGTVTLRGTSSLDCKEHEFVNKWDGIDDFVAPATVGWKSENAGSMLYLDAGKGGGSMPEGGISILLPQLVNPISILEVRSTAAGAGGEILVEKPVKQ